MPDSPQPKQFGRYRLDAELGRGGMGIVYKAFDPQLQRTVALKVLLSGPDAGANQVSRFTREAAAIAKLHHPNVVPIHEVGKVGTQPYFTMEFVEGTSLEGAIAKRTPIARKDTSMSGGHAATLATARTGGPWNLLDTLLVVRDVARGLGAAHEHDIIHRDVKPANVLLDREGRPVLTDFGLAKEVGGAERTALTMGGTLLGTPIYMSPEQAQARLSEIAAPSDVWSLGVVLYEMLVGMRPFEADSLGGLLRDIAKKDPAVPSKRLAEAGLPRLPAEVDAVVMKCLEKAPKDRYPDGNALADAIDLVISGEAKGGARRARKPGRTVAPRKKDSSAATIGLCVGGALVLIVAIVLLRHDETPAPKPTPKATPEEPSHVAEAPPTPAPPTPAPVDPPTAEPPPSRARAKAEPLYKKALSRPAETRPAWQESVELLDQALEADPDFGEAWYERGMILYKLSRYREAIDAFGKAIEHGGPQDWSHYMRGRVTADALDDFAGAGRDFEEVVGMDGDASLGLLASARLAIGRRQIDVAQRLCERVIGESKVHDDAYLILGFLCLKLNQDLDKALMYMDKAIELNPSLSKSWMNHAVVRYRRKEYEKGVADCDRAIELDPDSAYAYEWRAMCLQELGRNEEAVAAFDLAEARYGGKGHTTLFNRSKAKRAWAMALRGEGKKDEGRAKMEEAIADLEQFMKYVSSGPDHDSAQAEIDKARARLVEW